MKRIVLALIAALFLLTGCSGGQGSSLEEGRKYLEQGDYEKAAEAFNKAVEEDPENAAAYLERGQFYLLHGIEIEGSYSEEMLQKILSDCGKAQELDPKNEESAACIFYAYAQDNRYKEAAESLKDYISRNDTVSENIRDIMAKADSGQIEDIHGNARIFTAYDENGNVRYIYHYNYDRLGRVESLDWYSAQGTLQDHILCMYDENGRLDRGYITTDIFSGEITSVAYSYDDKGNVITEIWEDLQGSPYKRTYHYDENGRNDYMEDSVGGKVISTHRNSFDEAGNMIAEYTYNAQNELIDHVEYTFNDRNMCTEQKLYDRNGNVTYEWYFTYDKNDQLIRTEYYAGGELVDVRGE